MNEPSTESRDHGRASPGHENLVHLRLPRHAGEVLRETLRLDSRSGAFDPTLREAIAKALAEVEIGEL